MLYNKTILNKPMLFKDLLYKEYLAWTKGWFFTQACGVRAETLG